MNAKIAKIGLFFLTGIALFCLLETICYYLGARLGVISDIVCAILAIGGVWLGQYFWRTEEEEIAPSDKPAKANLWTIGILLVAIAAFTFILFSIAQAGTTQSMRTPWPLLLHGTLLAIAVLWLCTLLAAWRVQSPILTAVCSSLSLLATTLIAPAVYQLGFGFDGFLHRAGEQTMLQTGTLLPKPPYYIGQYVFVTALARWLPASLRTIDILLVPLLTALLPWLFLTIKREASWLIAGITLLLPLSLFVATTPQSFAYLLGLGAVALAIGNRTRFIHPLPSILLALWSLATHPLAGLPFLITVVLLFWINLHKKKEENWNLLRSPIAWLCIIGIGAITPLAFFWNSLHSSATMVWNAGALFSLSTYASFFQRLIPPATVIALFVDWITSIQFLLPLFLFISACIAIQKDKTRRAYWIALFFAGLSTSFAGLLLKTTGEFSFLIDYERGNYAERLFLIAQLLWLLPALQGLAYLLARITILRTSAIITILALCMGIQAANAYLALPRHDAGIIGHGWSVGTADQEAVRWIDQDAKNTAYTVLANQTVSAAAVEAFGFKRYAANDVFYYPIPTGGPLYDLFLRATGKDISQETIQAAATLGQSSRVYVVLNQYWWDADRVGQELAAIADQTISIQDQVTIYRFEIKNDNKR